MVLFVDDEEQILLALKRLFKFEPYTVQFASSGASALELLASSSEEVEVIISDQRMPNMNGTEFLIKSRETAPKAVRMLLTGYSDMQVTIDAINKGGATRYISKPWENQELLEIVRSAVEKYREDVQSALESRNLLEKQQQDQEQFRSLFDFLAGFVDLNAVTSKRHAMRTAELAVGISVSLGLTPAELEKVRMAALMHDIGLNALSSDGGEMSPECMTDAQYALFRSHPVIGQSMMRTVESLNDIGVIVRHHHENYDGSGFPDGLAGSDIPLGAAIINLAGSVESDVARYSGKLPLAQILEKVAARGGTEFDPKLISHMLRVAEGMYSGV